MRDLVAIVVLDGWGLAPPGPGNAVELADTPVFDDISITYMTRPRILSFRAVLE